MKTINYWVHQKGYCGNQLCCWGQPSDRVLKPKKLKVGKK